MILAVDDSDEILWLLERMLESAGHQVMLGRNGREALALAHAHRPELIVMDVMMPEMDGLEAVKSLRACDETSRIPVILVSAKGEEDDVAAGYESGADSYVAKPFTRKQILTAVDLVLKKPAH
jgi:DNA-binding response OmpR family regulator